MEGQLSQGTQQLNQSVKDAITLSARKPFYTGQTAYYLGVTAASSTKTVPEPADVVPESTFRNDDDSNPSKNKNYFHY